LFELSFSLVFTASPVCDGGHETIVNITKEGFVGPYYQTGGLKLLLENGNVLKRLTKNSKKSVLVIHEEGHGCDKSLSTLTRTG
jgi:hypothetical protein